MDQLTAGNLLAPASAGYHLGPNRGRSVRLFAGQARVLAAAEHTDGCLAIVECVLAAGTSLPPHVHQVEDLALYMVDGELRLCCAETTWEAAAGGFVRLPRGVPHAIEVVGDRPARLLLLAWPAGMEELLVELDGAVAGALRLDQQSNGRHLQAIAAMYRVTGFPDEPGARRG